MIAYVFGDDDYYPLGGEKDCHYIGPLDEAIKWAIANHETELRYNEVRICVVVNNQFVLVVERFLGCIQCEDEPQYACAAMFWGHRDKKYYVEYKPWKRRIVEGYPAERYRIDEMEKVSVKEVVRRIG